MKGLIIFIVVSHWMLFHYVFEFQRITLALARKNAPDNTENYQTTLTPRWVDFLSLIMTIFHVSAIVAILYFFGWIVAIIYAFATYFGVYSLVGFYIPFPPKEHYFRKIKNHLLNEIRQGKLDITLIYNQIFEVDK